MFAKTLLAAASIAALGANTVSAISTISAVGSKFFTSDGNQFYIKGNFVFLPTCLRSSVKDIP